MRKTSLLLLPNELLTAIYDHLDVDPAEYEVEPSTRVCRRLRPIAQARLYRDIFLVHGDSPWNKFDETLEHNPALGRFVKSLDLLTPFDDGSEEYADAACDDMVTLLERLPRLMALSLFGFDYLAMFAFFMDDRFQATLAARKIRSLYLGPHFQHEWPAYWWNELVHMPSLQELKLENQFFTDPAIMEDDKDNHPIKLPHLRRLKIDVGSLPEDGLAPLAKLVPHLEALTLTNIDDRLQHVQAIQSAPASLKRLSVSANRPDLPLSVAIDEVIAALPILEHLTLGPQLFSPDKLTTSLKTSNVASLTFMAASPVTDQLLLSLVGGPKRPRKLKVIVLDHVSASRNTPLRRRLDYQLPLPAFDRFDTLKENLKPEWQDGCTEEGLVKAIEAARKVGIRIGGLAMDCVGWSAHFDEQLERCLIEHGLETDNFDLAARHFSNDRIVAWLEQHSPILCARLRAGGRPA
ncbi:hypothetical protein JCM10908_002613 [Rhodotorula pacifica]|uniref:uncharacterized protein n=1 Tax=Rhodotorula pacifica TaxID=1495444 RepID=UPI00317D2D74